MRLSNKDRICHKCAKSYTHEAGLMIDTSTTTEKATTPPSDPMDFTGTWITRDGRQVIIYGIADDGVHFWGRVAGIVSSLIWNAYTGNSHDSANLDLVQRLSGFTK